jgi:hypothetical protein
MPCERRESMKKAIELLETAKLDLIKFSRDHSRIILAMSALSNIEEALYDLRLRPRWETPEQREKRTGEAWPDNAPAYFNLWFLTKDSKYTPGIWQLMELGKARKEVERLTSLEIKTAIVCATEAGPPPDGWKPEE